MSNDDQFLPIRKLPSRFVPYDQQPELYMRRLKLSEVDFVFANSDRPAEIIKYLSTRDVLRGIDMGELTMDDWSFVELTLTASTFPETKFTIGKDKCPECGDKTHYVEIDLGDGEIKRFEKRGEFQTLVVPRDIAFEELDSEVALPIAIDGITDSADFYRVKHFLTIYDEGLLDTLSECQQEYSLFYDSIVDKDNPTLAEVNKATALSRATKAAQDAVDRRKMELMFGVNYDDMAYGDDLVFAFLTEKLKHGPNLVFPVKCNICGHEMEITTRWTVASFIPFRTDSKSPGNRVRFGRVSAPEPTGHKKPGLSTRPVALQPNVGNAQGT